MGEDVPEPHLRIFEVDSEIEAAPGKAQPSPEWSSIRLEAYPSADHSSEDQNYEVRRAAIDSRSQSARATAREELTLRSVASLQDRIMAGIVDCALVGIAFLLFVYVFSASTARVPEGRAAVIGAAVILLAIFVLYQLIFFSFSESTPGMLYARIALCTFEDNNLSRAELRKRVFALLLAAAPLGLGLLYAIFDEDHLGWHDRMTRSYQRSYR